MSLMRLVAMFNTINIKQVVPLMKQFQTTFLCNPRRYDQSSVWDIRTREYTARSGTPGSGVGKGGGAGGSVRESGGGLGKYGAAQEEGYFHHKQREDIEKLKKQLQQGYPVTHRKPEK
ncbi:unnamed protein product [Chrysodeixis includens]|uniref:Uncharacterized protein n=1 Tax=Chrysodeixis includens TaxID=689277 RepID=A0A9P0BQF1_CHRIL|nr:unnamed protein product [Chrysodeixis includens]